MALAMSNPKTITYALIKSCRNIVQSNIVRERVFSKMHTIFHIVMYNILYG